MKRQQAIRSECLLQLYGSGAIPISLEHIQKVARNGDFDYTAAEIRDQLHFLRGQGLCEEVEDKATGLVRYRITSAGMLAYENK